MRAYAENQMPKMNKIVRELCRLALTTDLSNPCIARILQCHPATVRRYRERLSQLGLTWSTIRQVDDVEILSRINNGREKNRKDFYLPEWSYIDRELRRVGVTRGLLYEEYRSVRPPAGKVLLSPRHFNRKLEEYRSEGDLVMRQDRKGGEKVFVDFSGKGILYTDPSSGQKVKAELFVGAIGASGRLYWEACRNQRLECWIAANTNMLHHFGGAPQIIVPDCLKSAVTVWGREDGINPTYAEFARHYDCVVVPARPGEPQDKGLVENGVLQAQRWALAKLRDREFFSIDEINKALFDLLEEFNNKPFKRRPLSSRMSVFTELDEPALRPLPAEKYEFAEWSNHTIGPDYHVPCDGRYYSVPHIYKGHQVRVRRSARTVRIYHASQEIATHVRRWDDYRDSTIPAHRPLHHRVMDEEQAAIFRRWSAAIGPATAQLVEAHLTMTDRYRPVLMRLLAVQKVARDFGDSRFEKACARALKLGAPLAPSLRSMLQARMEDVPLGSAEDPEPIVSPKRNVRGKDYYAKKQG